MSFALRFGRDFLISRALLTKPARPAEMCNRCFHGSLTVIDRTPRPNRRGARQKCGSPLSCARSVGRRISLKDPDLLGTSVEVSRHLDEETNRRGLPDAHRPCSAPESRSQGSSRARPRLREFVDAWARDSPLRRQPQGPLLSPRAHRRRAHRSRHQRRGGLSPGRGAQRHSPRRHGPRPRRSGDAGPGRHPPRRRALRASATRAAQSHSPRRPLLGGPKRNERVARGAKERRSQGAPRDGWGGRDERDALTGLAQLGWASSFCEEAVVQTPVKRGLSSDASAHPALSIATFRPQ